MAMIEEACARAGRRGVPIKGDESTATDEVMEAGDHAVGELSPESSPLAIDASQVAVPEHSHVGESQSNGRAERAVKPIPIKFGQ